jgi:hypothetical protein
MALMLKLAVLMHVSFLRRAMHICRADCDKRTAVLAGRCPVSPSSMPKSLSDAWRTL